MNWHNAHIVEVKIRLKNLYQSRRSEVGIQRKAIYAANRKNAIKQSVEWKRLNSDKVKASNKRCWPNNRERHKLKELKRRAAKRKSIGNFTKQDIQEIFLLQKCKCGYCKESIKKAYHIDHIIALVNGGSNERKNIQLLCAKCNLRKQARDPIDYAKTIGLLI